jgi:hypothetical protein
MAKLSKVSAGTKKTVDNFPKLCDTLRMSCRKQLWPCSPQPMGESGKIYEQGHSFSLDRAGCLTSQDRFLGANADGLSGVDFPHRNSNEAISRSRNRKPRLTPCGVTRPGSSTPGLRNLRMKPEIPSAPPKPRAPLRPVVSRYRLTPEFGAVTA